MTNHKKCAYEKYSVETGKNESNFGLNKSTNKINGYTTVIVITFLMISHVVKRIEVIYKRWKDNINASSLLNLLVFM